MAIVTRSRNCSECGKPLGSTYGKCHKCGGESKRGGKRCDGRQWKGWFGLEPTAIKAAERAHGNVLPLDQ